MSEKFTLWEDDKSLRISDGTHMNMEIEIDFDDVDHCSVMRQAKRLLKLINDNRNTLTK